MLKHYLLTLLVAFATTTAFAQTTDEAEIQQTFNDYLKVLEAQNTDALLDYMYPEIFTLFARETLKKQMDALYADTTTKVTFDAAKIHSVSKPMVVQGVKYTLLKYSYNMLMQVAPVIDDEPVNSKDMVDAFALIYGKGAVSYNKAQNVYVLKLKREMFAVKGPNYNGWKFIEHKKESEVLLKKLLPDEVVKKFL